MKVKVNSLTQKEFTEYADSTYAKPVKMALAFFIGIAVILIIVSMNKAELEGAIEPLWWTVGILAFLLIASNAAISIVFNKSGLSKTQCIYSFSDEGMVISMGKLKGTLEWKYVLRIKETKNLWIMRVPNSQFILPKRCMDESKWEELIEKNVDEGKIKKMRYKKSDAERTKDDERDS